MEAKELMAFDLVMFDRTYPPTEKKPTKLTLQDIVSIEQGKECEPIRLTPEILEKNGFIKSRIGPEPYGYPFDNYHIDAKEKCEDENAEWFGGVDVKRFDGSEQLILSICSHKVSITRYYVTYVHELQHALRLCGFTDLADNFKL